MEERLSKVGAGTERIKVCAQLERSLMWSVRQAQDELPQHTRGQMIEYIARLAKAVRLPSDTVFTAAALLDLACLRLGPAVARTQLPELSSAMVRLLHKMDIAHRTLCGADLVHKASEFAEQLCSQGDSNTKVNITMNDLVNAEATLASALQWQFHVPSLQQWIQMFVTRLAEFYPRATPRLEWTYQTSIGFAERIVLKQITYKAVAPQEIALGLFCTGLVLAGIVPVGSLCPGGDDEAVWEAQWRNQQMWPGIPVPSTPSLIQTQLGASLLQVVTENPIHVLQGATLRSIRLVWASVLTLELAGA